MNKAKDSSPDKDFHAKDYASPVNSDCCADTDSENDGPDGPEDEIFEGLVDFDDLGTQNNAFIQSNDSNLSSRSFQSSIDCHEIPKVVSLSAEFKYDGQRVQVLNTIEI